MSLTPHLETDEACIKAASETLPRMTAFFIEELRKPPARTASANRQGASPCDLSEVISIPFGRRSKGVKRVRRETSTVLPLPFQALATDRRSHRENQVIQTLINGIAHHFNNLMTGIWGNVSLIRMQLGPGHASSGRVAEMENMIQEGAYLIHLILGYLGERRSTIKMVRMHQLRDQIDRYLPRNHGHERLAGQIHWGKIARQPSLMAGGSARVIQVLLDGIDALRRSIVLDTLDDLDVQRRIGIIAALVQRGGLMTSQLLCYAGDIPIQKRPTNLKAMLKRQCRRARERYGHLRISASVTPRLPRIALDQRHIEWVVTHLIDNAAREMPGGGGLTLTLKPMFADKPLDRCGVHHGKDYVVLSVEDDGPGMTGALQLRIFDPFFTRSESGRMPGLGLAAAGGIIRKHKGYIQVRSKPGRGSCFRIHLPVA